MGAIRVKRCAATGCENQFTPGNHNPHQKFCCHRCAVRENDTRRPKRLKTGMPRKSRSWRETSRKCPGCQKAFFVSSRHPDQICCSRECSLKVRSNDQGTKTECCVCRREC